MIRMEAEFTEKNAAPEIDLNGDADGTGNSIKYVENSPAIAIAPDAIAFDDSDYFDGASLIVEFKDRSTSDDQLRIVSGRFGESPVYALENDLYYKDEIIGSISGGNDGWTALLISFSGKVTADIVQAVIRSIGYANFSQDPLEGERFVTFTLVDREGAASRAAGASIYVVPVDSPAVAEDDTVSTTEDEVGTGNLFDPHGPGNDYDPDGDKLRIAAVNGSQADVGQTIKLRSGALLTVDEDGTYRYDPNGQFDYLTNKETGATNISAVDRFEYTLADGGTATVTVIINGAADPGDKLLGDEKSNAITGAERADMVMLEQGGDDSAFSGAGNDILYFGAAFTGADVANGGDGRDVLVLQGNYTLTLSATNIANLESISLQSGARTTWGDTANNFYDYNITMADANVTAGQQLIVNGQSLRAGEDFTFDGSAESGDGKFLVYGGNGVDHFTGGAGNDVFFFEGDRWGPSDTVNGGAGRDALIISSGTGLAHIEFGANSLAGIEAISVNARYATDPGARPSYELVLNNGNVAPGAALIVNASSLTDPAQTLNVDGSAVRDGQLILLGGAGNDVLTGGLGADSLTGGGGADTYRYTRAAQSTASATDQIHGFASGTDKIDLASIDANSFAGGNQAFHWIGSAAFTGGGAASAGELRAYANGGSWFVEGDTNGDGTADLVIQLAAPAAPVVAGDFLL